MQWIKHAFRWGYGYMVLALLGGLAYQPFIPVAYAGNYMTATMLIKMAESEDISRRAMAHGYVAAIHDELADLPVDNPNCFAVPQAVDMQDMAERTIHFVNWYTHEFKGWPRHKDINYPAKELVHLGLVQQFRCKPI